MTHARTLLACAAIVGVLAAVGCGGGDENVPGDAVAIVGDEEIPKADFDGLIAQARRSYKLQKRTFPKAGTPEYNNLKSQAVQFLVQREQFEQQAADMDVEVSDKQVGSRLSQIKKTYFGGNEKRYRTQLKQQGLTDEQVRKDIRAQLIQEAIFKKVTEEVKVTDREIEEYYNKNKTQYGTPESREIRHILVSSRKQANQLYDRIKGGESFAKLARRYSQDPGSKTQGGKLTVARGQTVAPFDHTAFLLGEGQLSRPVKTQYGWHLIEPLSGVKPAKVTPLKSVKEQIRQQLLQTKRNDAMTKWVEETKKEYCDGELEYQVGFQPKPDPCASQAKTTTTK